MGGLIDDKDAVEQGGGLLGNPLINIGAGLLAAGGPSLTPVSTGQGLAQGLGLAQTAQAQGLQNQLTRARLEGEARRRRATDELRGLLDTGGNKQLGLLADIAPGALAQGLINQSSPRQSALERNAAALGVDLTTLSEEEKRNLLLGGNTARLDGFIKQLQAEKLLGDIKAGEANRKAAQVEAESEATAKARGVSSSLSNLTTLTEIITDPSSSISGAVQDPLAAVGRARTLDMAAIDQTLSEAVKGNATDRRLSTALRSKPNVLSQAISPGSNARSVLGRLKLLRDFSKLTPEQARVADANISKLEEFLAAEARAQAGRSRSRAAEPRGAAAPGGPRNFRHQDAALEAPSRGGVNIGDEVIVGGKRFRVER